MKTKLVRPAFLAILFLPFLCFAQESSGSKYASHDWQLKDFTTDSVHGASVTRAYNELLKGKKSQTIIVAVIDAGLDTAHEDLQGRVWTNKKEIPGNGIDDDRNGYIDDIHGWNFLGGKNGRNIESESSEESRVYYNLHSRFGNITDSSRITAAQKADYRDWITMRDKRRTDSANNIVRVARIHMLIGIIDSANNTWKAILKKDSLTIQNITAGTTADTTALRLQAFLAEFAETRGIPVELPMDALLDAGRSQLTALQKSVSGDTTDPNAQRRDIIGDRYDDITDRSYGNNNIAAGTPTHGTHVAGIIAANRNNGIGMDGIADNVLIMPLRAVPDGDERDKDIALAIRYAVDNGARIINMSFGKPYSPGKAWVDDAVKYAAQKDVLLVHAAGNDAHDIDTINAYPTAIYQGTANHAPNFIAIGASAGGPDSLLAASFSNYGKQETDFFAPGVQVYSTIPGSKYASFSGTSMATPVVAGVAALVLEYYPTLSAKQLRYVLEQSVSRYPGDIVSTPGTDVKTDFANLSEKGGIVNAYNALKLAATLKGERKGN